MDKCWEYDKYQHQLYIDFKQAYDNALRVELWYAMELINDDVKQVGAISTLFINIALTKKTRKAKTETLIFRNLGTRLILACAGDMT